MRVLTWSFTIVYSIYVLSFVSCSEDQKTDNSPINITLRYSRFKEICAKWSGTARDSDFSTEYELLKYTDYTDRMKDFINKYPYVTIDGTCKCRSDLWNNWKDDCPGPLWTFETIHFITNQYFNNYVYERHGDEFGWNLGAQIGFGFKVKEDYLYLRPFMNGWVYKAGAWWSCLQYGLSATKITFHSEDNSTKRIVNPSVVIVS